MDSRYPASVSRLTEAERALVAAWREHRVESRPGPSLSADEQYLIREWREWQASPSLRPLWAEELRHSLREQVPDVPLYTGFSDDSGFLVQAPARFLGMLIGGVTGEATAGRSGERSSAALFVLEGLIRAHTGSRLSGTADPVLCARDGLLRWLHTRGGPRANSADGWLIEQDLPRDPRHDDPAMLTALTQIATGRRHGTRLYPINNAESALAVPLGALASIWSNRDDVVFSLGCDLAALTHGGPHGHVPAGVMAVTVFWLLRGRTLGDSFQRALAYSPDSAAFLSNAARLGSNRPPGYLPGAAQLDAMGTTRCGVQALATAIRVALACEDDVAAALRIAADHSGDTGTAATLTGQLLGALHGPAAIPVDDDFGLRPVVEALAVDAGIEFGQQPDKSDQWTRRYPLSEPGKPVTATNYRTGLAGRPRFAGSADRFVGAMMGCAIGDALGNPIASDSWQEIQARHGFLRYYVPTEHRPGGRLGSDSQLLLFSLEGLIRANVSRRTADTVDPSWHVQHAYQRWLHTQHLSWSRAAGEFLGETREPDGWLVEQRALYEIRNPGRTLMRTLIAFAQGRHSMGTPENPVSDARDSSAVTRAIAAALWSDDSGEVFRVAAGMAALTHGHAMAYLSAGAMGFLVTRLVRGEPLDAATESIVDLLPRHAGHERISRRISAALRLARDGPGDPAILERELGTGWTAPDALGIGLYAALVSRGDFDTALATAVNHAGNSATTGAMCGALMGAMLGADHIPEHWPADLELCEVVERLAYEATLEFGPHPPREPDWFRRYPPT